MTTMRTILMTACLLSLAACGGRGGGGNNAAAENADSGTGQEQVPDNLADDPQNMAVPITPPSPSPVAALPAGFQGRWGMVPNDCDPKMDDAAKGLMTIAGNGLRFYESRATATDIRATAPGKLVAMLSYSGEGQTWRKATTLTLLDEGRTLVREEQDPAGAFRYQRCPALQESSR